MAERGQPEATEGETVEIQAGLAFSVVIPHSVTALSFSQTGGNNGPSRLGFLVREPNMLRTRLERWRKNQAALEILEGGRFILHRWAQRRSFSRSLSLKHKHGWGNL